MPHEHEWHFVASNELVAQVEQFRAKMETLAAELAATEPGRPVHERDIVERAHVLRAAELLLRRVESISLPSPAACPVFVSYSSQDEDFVEELADDLQEQGIRSFVANRSVQPASDWTESIWQALRDCRVVLVVVTPAAIRSRWCDYEIGAALALRKNVVPALRHVSSSKLPGALGRIQAVRVQTRAQQKKLVKLLRDLCSQ